MGTVRFITFTDVHVSDTNPGARVGNYKEDILNKLRAIKKIGLALKVNFYICAGDVFHIKAPLRNSHGTVGELIDLFKSFGAPIYTIEGNHDLQYDRAESIDNQPLGVLFKSGAMVKLRKEILSFDGIRVSLRGFPFEEEPDLTKVEKYEQEFDVGVCALHLNATPTGGMLFKSKLFSYPELSELGDDIFVLGHYHLDQGVQKVSKDGRDQHFINVGAVCRGALDEDSITRTPKFSVVTITKDEEGKVDIKIQQGKLPVRPAPEVFDIIKKQETDEKLKVAEEFVEALHKQSVSDDITTDTVGAEIEGLNVEKDIINKLKHYMAEAQVLISKV